MDSKNLDRSKRMLDLEYALSQINHSIILDENGDPIIFERNVLTKAFDLENIDISRELKWLGLKGVTKNAT